MRVRTIVGLLLVAIAFGQSLAHALEFPGQLRLDEATYRAVQQIYYPGFTIAGIAEPVSMIVIGVLLYFTPYGTGRFWWTAAALVLMIAVHGIYWLMIHPVNKVWVEGGDLSRVGSSFFSAFSGGGAARYWSELRNTWEMSHMARAVLAPLALTVITVATSLYEAGQMPSA